MPGGAGSGTRTIQILGPLRESHRVHGCSAQEWGNLHEFRVVSGHNRGVDLFYC